MKVKVLKVISCENESSGFNFLINERFIFNETWICPSCKTDNIQLIGHIKSNVEVLEVELYE
ncbi:hypothetical protein [Desertibacillus haloalkaliphilus]|uniref:hypothetical protein n=1 Tax=Desertibacillus haloalkaliphilus TaxID=1328930 RepID=UPI001C25472B|nr:hypothetical protein [Desertibacillus haloalkaliphilus]MBU8908128.1 hypothetical protein [Desertibacillus haloalkaliphilus]